MLTREKRSQIKFNEAKNRGGGMQGTKEYKSWIISELERYYKFYDKNKKSDQL